MTIQFVLLAVGLVFILMGANWLVDGASSIAKKTGMSEFIIGLTIVGIGTSTPEMVVSFISAIQGKSDMAIGNVIGSNIFNTLMILGVTAMITPLIITKESLKRDIPLNIFVTVLLILLGMKSTIFGVGSDRLTRIDGIILLAIMVMYFRLLLRKPDNVQESEDDDDSVKVMGTGKSIFLIILGLIGHTGKEARLCNIGKKNIRTEADFLHSLNVIHIKTIIQISVICHSRINDFDQIFFTC